MKIIKTRFSLMLIGSVCLLAACGGGASTSSTSSDGPSITNSTVVDTTTTTVDTTTTLPLVPTMPLTGLPVIDEAVAARPAIVAKIDNHRAARPQSGLNQADIVYEENVENWTRFALVMHSQGSDPIGPVRSGRTQDINLLTSLNHPLFLWSGGNPTVGKLIKKSELINMSASAASKGGGFFRSSDKQAPHNLYSKTTNIWALDAGRGGTPPAQFAYRTATDVVSGTAVSGVKLSMDGNMHASWEWDSVTSKFLRRHDNTAHKDSDGAQVNVDNVVIIVCDYKFSVADNNSPEAQTTGTGIAWVFSSGMWTEGTWSRLDNHAPWTLTDNTGRAILLTPGRTWVELARDRQSVVVPSGQKFQDIPWPKR